MKRLDFRLHDFTRYAWVSDQAEAIWAPRIQRIMAAWAELEQRSVAAGLRRCAITLVQPSELEALGERVRAHGLTVTTIAQVALGRSPYQSSAAPAEPGQPVAHQVALGRPEDGAALAEAWRTGEQDVVANLLGYPACCARFFSRVWVEERRIDTTWAMVEGEAGEKGEVEVHGPEGCNILLRWLGVRPVPHLPCRFDCVDTAELAQKLVELGHEAGFVEEFDWLYQMLDWPTEWSALHGIAEIKTPVVKIAASTDATANMLRVRRPGATWPPEGARGLSFPYQPPVRPHLTGSAAYQRGLRIIHE